MKDWQDAATFDKSPRAVAVYVDGGKIDAAPTPGADLVGLCWVLVLFLVVLWAVERTESRRRL